MRAASAVLALALLAAAPAAGQSGAPAPQPQEPLPPANPYRDLFTRWDGANRDSLEAEASRTAPAAAPDGNSIPAYSPLVSRPREEAIALGERVGAVVRAGNCAEGERMARAAGDFPLVRAVREHCHGSR
jgi:hypothetical protein